jgi:predicted transcriptional regulator
LAQPPKKTKRKAKAELISQVLSTAMAHPVRVDVFAILLEREATVSEMAQELDVQRSKVGYHVSVLDDLGCIERTDSRPVNGGRAVEYVYRAAGRAYFDPDAWNQLGPAEQRSASFNMVRTISHDINTALEKGTFHEPRNKHISRTPTRVDREGWDQVMSFLDRVLFEFFELQEEIEERCRQTDVETFPIKVEILQFRSPGRTLRLKPK